MRPLLCEYSVSPTNPLDDPRARAWLCRQLPWDWADEFTVLWCSPGHEYLLPFHEWRRERWDRLPREQRHGYLWEAINSARPIAGGES